MRLAALLLLALFLIACGPKAATSDDLDTQTVKLPGGQEIRAEVMTNPQDMARGMMFRDSLAPDRGMLFVHTSPGKYPYWMFQCRIPLDILWMDSDRRIVEISADTPPCQGPANRCPTYGGHRQSQFVLELAGGMAAKYGLKAGDELEF